MSPRPRLEVAEVIRSYGQAYRKRYRPSPAQSRVMRAITQCRTGTLGGHVQACDHCGERQISYNSCRNRHCPKCQGSQTAQWLEAQQPHLLPVPYFHVVFTLPQLLAPLALRNPRVVYGLLFQAASRTLLEVAANPRHLGATIGFLAVLHTWGQNLHHHPHLHCVVPAGGLAPDGSRWVSSSPHFFLPVRVLSRLFRGKFLALLREAFDDGRLRFHGAIEPLANRSAFLGLVSKARRTEWVVYAKRPFGGPATVLKYLARYTHRVAISNHRLQAIEDGRVSFKYKDYARGRRLRTLSLEATEFIRRFLLHALPKGFVRIRRYGLMANIHRDRKLAWCRELLGGLKDREPIDDPSAGIEPYEPAVLRCPSCKEGIMRRIQGVVPWAALRARPPPRAPPVPVPS
ncbi:MAG TPA: IS91 family transposase [Candidatus Acetothermia bacterium]|nr:IS91 family transposase [Candidatus Acetothermia bacterium]